MLMIAFLQLRVVIIKLSTFYYDVKLKSSTKLTITEYQACFLSFEEHISRGCYSDGMRESEAVGEAVGGLVTIIGEVVGAVVGGLVTIIDVMPLFMLIPPFMLLIPPFMLLIPPFMLLMPPFIPPPPSIDCIPIAGDGEEGCDMSGAGVGVP
jgi:hypothetical protein